VGLRYLVLIALLFASVGIISFAANPARESVPGVTPGYVPIGATVPQGNFSATVGCSAASCHGSGQNGKLGGEHSTWIDSDPHTKAFQVLRNEASQIISKNLGRTMPATEDASCLACHAVDHDRYYNGEKLEERQHNEGVSCEACHGPSTKWIAAHYSPAWKTLSNREKFDQYGFVPTKDHAARILNCAMCHVGGRDREVNHDLIAAGHPRLSFEYTRYHFSEKYEEKHWKEHVANPDFEIRTWFVGQVASLRAATDLLVVRAERSLEQKAPWPELSESSCYACHQNLGAELRSNTENALRPRKPGTLGWQVWYSAFTKNLPTLASVLQPTVTGVPVTTLDALRAEMEKPVPNAAKVVPLAKQVVSELDTWLVQLQGSNPSWNLSSGQIQLLGKTILDSAIDPASGKLRDYEWDFLAQHALALTAVYHAAGGSANPTVAGWKDALVEVRQKLAFPKEGSRYDSPRGFKPDSVYPGFKKLHELTR
jgi:predicted CxxxxCH...CXXCH cytochrome family protein